MLLLLLSATQSAAPPAPAAAVARLTYVRGESMRLSLEPHTGGTVLTYVDAPSVRVALVGDTD